MKRFLKNRVNLCAGNYCLLMAQFWYTILTVFPFTTYF